MHKSTQTVTTEQTYTVEGPNDEGQYQINYDGTWFPADNRNAWDDDERKAIQQHIDSLPKPPTVDSAWEEIKRAQGVLGKVWYPLEESVHESTYLTADEAITLMELLGKVR